MMKSNSPKNIYLIIFLSLCFLSAIFFFYIYASLKNESDNTQDKYATGYYDITASDKSKFVWFRVSKAATRTTANVLKKNFKLSIPQGYAIPYSNTKYAGYFKFAFVRNPWDRILSCYQNKVAAKTYPIFEECYNKDFDYFVRFIDRKDLSTADRHIKPQTLLIPVDDLDFIGRLETFSTDLPYVLGIIGAKDLNYKHKNRSDHLHYSHYYTDETREIIARKYKDDIEIFGYHFETIQNN